jgi:phosphohistidine phosphatase SixA
MNKQDPIYLFLIRHAEAKSAAFSAGRPLSDRGIVEAKLLGENLKKDNFEVPTIINSGVLRSEQTSEIIKEGLGNGKIIQNPRLAEGFSNNEAYWLTYIETIQETVMLVGHNPTIFDILKLANPGINFEFTTGSCICLKKDQSKLTFSEYWSYKIPKD